MTITDLRPPSVRGKTGSQGSSSTKRRRRFLSRRGGFALLLLIGLVGGFLLAGSRGNKNNVGVSAKFIPPNMHLVYDSTFDSTIINPPPFSTCLPWSNTLAGCSNFGNPELQWFLPSQVSISGGTLNLVASKLPVTGIGAHGAPEVYPWRSGIITTFDSFKFTYGYVQFTAQVPSGSGLWSTFWMLPTSKSWPPEIDIAAILGSSSNKVSAFYHPAGQGPVVQANTLSSHSYSNGWHTYALDWEPGSLAWYVDGHKFKQYNGPTPSVPMYLLADLAVENVFDAGPNASTPANATLAIKEIKVYQKTAP